MKKEKILFNDIWDYVQDADITGYSWGATHSDKEYVICEVDISEDPSLEIDYQKRDKVIEKGDKTYIAIDWGEGKGSYILESEVKGKGWGHFWTCCYYNNEDMMIYSYGCIHNTLEEAKEHMEDWHEVKEENYEVRQQG